MTYVDPNLTTIEDALRTLTPLLDDMKTQGNDPVSYLASVFQGEDHAKMSTIGSALIEQKSLTAAEWKKTERLSRAQDALGAIPSTATHFLELYLRKYPIDISARGDVTPKALPFVFGHQIEPEHLTGNGAAINNAAVNRYRETFNMEDLQRKLEIMSSDLKFGFTASQISNVITEWHKQMKLDEWTSFAGRLSYDITANVAATSEDDWRRLVQAAFKFAREEGDGMVSEDITIAVHQQMIYQIKRKLHNKPINIPLMMVLFGPQGVGKTGYLKLFLAPLEDFQRPANFLQLTEGKDIELFEEHYALVLDEMAHAARTEMDAVKNVITQEVMAARLMRTNGAKKFRNNTTLFGSSNKRISQLIRDETGLRRFFELFFTDKADWDTLNSIDMLRLWRSVDENGPDPLLPHMASVRKVQAGNLTKSTVEEWAEQITEWAQRGLGKQQAYIMYRDWCREYYPRRGLDLDNWHAEMQRLIGYSNVNPFAFEWKRASSGMVYKKI